MMNHCHLLPDWPFTMKCFIPQFPTVIYNQTTIGNKKKENYCKNSIFVIYFCV